MIAAAMETARLYPDRVFALHGLPEAILSDRDSKFTSAFWTNLCEMLGTHQKLTTAFREHGVTERVNLTIENYLRAFSNASDNWDELLALAEFTYNSRHQSSISMSPFEADLGYQPITPARWKSVKESKVWNDTAQTLSKKFLEVQNWRSCAIVYKQFGYIPCWYHKEETRTQMDRTLSGSEKIGHDYYRLELPTRVKFHSVFHTSMLKPYVQSDRLEQTIFKVPLPDGTEGELVEDIVGFRRRKGKPEYHVKWLGQSRLTWEPLENLQYVPDLVRNFHERQTTMSSDNLLKEGMSGM
ncbi:unnamed protein product [Phytophthora lilii]|uniref:Unnamed protein product n=1 Tax=Phytophthora lilii TaxID=2077276 RepID=A0A9W6WMV3_9STRA|nr:unnamed protein product [Phytophthora lilii]